VNDILLKLDPRTLEGKQVIKLRETGYVPSVVYGGQGKPISTQSPLIETTKVINAAGKHTPVNLIIDGKKKLAIIKNIDINPVGQKLRHVAFHTINQNDVITTEVPIELVGQGESAAERAGLVILQAIEKIEIKAKPSDLPESLKLSITSLTTTDDRLMISDIKLPKGVEFADAEQDMELVIANVYEPSALQAANEAAGGEAEAEDVNKVETENTEETTTENSTETKPTSTGK
jgi:large subunit ribosomal protein L25